MLFWVSFHPVTFAVPLFFSPSLQWTLHFFNLEQMKAQMWYEMVRATIMKFLSLACISCLLTIFKMPTDIIFSPSSSGSPSPVCSRQSAQIYFLSSCIKLDRVPLDGYDINNSGLSTKKILGSICGMFRQGWKFFTLNLGKLILVSKNSLPHLLFWPSKKRLPSTHLCTRRTSGEHLGYNSSLGGGGSWIK